MLLKEKAEQVLPLLHETGLGAWLIFARASSICRCASACLSSSVIIMRLIQPDPAPRWNPPDDRWAERRGVPNGARLR